MTTTVETLRVHPVKSMQGHEVDHLDLTPSGFAGDRRWALIDDESGRLMSAKRWSALLLATAGPDGIRLPDGRDLPYGDPDTDELLSRWLDRPVTLTEAAPGTAVAYEMTLDPPNDDADLFAIDAPPGSFLDLAAGHLLSAATLGHCAAEHPDLDWDVRRFRPNLVVAGDLDPFGEDEWCGRTLRIGTAALAGRQPTVRCAMPLRAQPGLDRQAGLYAALEERHANHLGIYLDAVEPGRVRVGDEVAVA